MRRSSLDIILWLLVILQAGVLIYILLKEPPQEESLLREKPSREIGLSEKELAIVHHEVEDARQTATFMQRISSQIPNYSVGMASSSGEPSFSILQRSFQKRFDHDKLIQVNRAAFLQMIDAFDLEETDFDIWTENGLDWIIQIRSIIYYKYLRGKCIVLMENVQDLIDNETLRIATQPPATFSASQGGRCNLEDFFREFRTLEETKIWYQELAKEYPSHATFVEAISPTKTVEGRAIFAIKIGNKSISNKKAIFVHGLQHAREWISGSTVNYVAFKLLSDWAPKRRGSNDPYLEEDQLPREEPCVEASLLDLVEVIIVPIMNPDGYHYTWTSNRLWRKNRAKNVPFGRGVDLNRNWGEHWGGPGTSANPMSDIYCGPSANSEPEVQAMESFYLQQSCLYDNAEGTSLFEKSTLDRSPECSGRMLGVIDFHAYSQLVMWPYGYTNTPYKYDDQHRQIADKLVKIIRKAPTSSSADPSPLLSPISTKKVRGADYKAIPIRDLYLASGSSIDWYSSPSNIALFKGKVPYTMTFELRPLPSDPRGFILPPSEILPTGQEIYPAFLKFIRTCLEEPLHE